MQLHWIEQFAEDRRRELYAFYSKEWWTQGREYDDVIQVLEHSDIVLGCCSDAGRLIGFARVLTDFTFKAMIFDVIVDEPFRRQGVGNAIIDRIKGHEALQKVRSFELYCPDQLVAFYEGLGFAKSSSSLLRHQR
ncbi:GNAT family N-acetyltransferase [Devosia sp.]|uniref:GNAT family N-acetyltransferase n=1 Tax=Devosia sp. TaxID=1871048 RepID=UPI002FC7C374